MRRARGRHHDKSQQIAWMAEWPAALFTSIWGHDPRSNLSSGFHQISRYQLSRFLRSIIAHVGTWATLAA